MVDKPSDLVQGTLDMLILKTLELEPMHGYGIAMRIEQISKGLPGESGIVVSGIPQAGTRPAGSRANGGTLRTIGALSITFCKRSGANSSRARPANGRDKQRLSRGFSRRSRRR